MSTSKFFTTKNFKKSPTRRGGRIPKNYFFSQNLTKNGGHYILSAMAKGSNTLRWSNIQTFSLMYIDEMRYKGQVFK
jgi:hypothetical protein